MATNRICITVYRIFPFSICTRLNITALACIARLIVYGLKSTENAIRLTISPNSNSDHGISHLARRRRTALLALVLSMYAEARLGFLTNSLMYDSTSARFASPRGDFLKCAAKSFAVVITSMATVLRRKIRQLGSVTATRKSAVVCLLAGSYLKKC